MYWSTPSNVSMKEADQYSIKWDMFLAAGLILQLDRHDGMSVLQNVEKRNEDLNLNESQGVLPSQINSVV